MVRRLFAAAFVITTWTTPVAAGDVERGRETAVQWCSECHLVGEQGTAIDGAPPFASVANDPAKTTSQLTMWLNDPHGQMPKLDLTRQEIDDVIAYIQSLRTD